MLIVDIQEKFRQVINGFKGIISNVSKLIQAFNILKISILVTEQYPKGLGKTVEELEEVLKKYEKIEKISFDCFNDKKFVKLIEKERKKNLIICGIEAHVCVTQTVLSALEKGFNVYLIADAISSRKKSDYEIAIKRMIHEGAKLASTEMIIFQMIKDSKDEEFKELSNIIK